MSQESPSPGSAGSVPPPEQRQRALQEELRSLVDVVGAAPLVDLLLERGFELGTTDIHLDPREDGSHVRMRIDGILHDILTLSPHLTQQVISRIKLLAGMDITERRTSQDGHIASATSRQRRDVRVGSGPTIHGERLVLRLMPDSSQLTTLDDLGMEPHQKDQILQALRSPFGMTLSVGPVGCGKSTTTYACLHKLNDPGLSLATIEDPVERRIAGVNQMQIDPKADFGFPEALRGVLRQDPNVIMVGEIRDPETAYIAVRAGLTGVQVLSTLHANSTTAVIDVFRQFQIPPMFVADAVTCIIAQRLLRKVCTQHRDYYTPDASTAQMLGIPPDEASDFQLVRGRPNDSNFHTGYAGRTGVFEVLRMSDPIREAILDNRSAGEIEDISRQYGMATLEESTARKVLSGVTSIEEMHRVLMI